MATATGDPQALGQSAIVRAWIMLETGRPDEAAKVVDRIVEHARAAPAIVAGPPAVNAFVAVARGADLAEIVDLLPDTPYARAARLWLDGDPRGAADVYATLEKFETGEAMARLAAARDLAAKGRFDEADHEARRAIDLYRPMRAERYVREAETLLSTAAAATERPG